METARATPESPCGLVIVNTGHGKGKTTAALGLLLRAWGRGMKVVMLQFMKSPTSNYGEHRAAARIGLEIVAHGSGFSWQPGNAEKSQTLARELWGKAKEVITGGQYAMVILDEFSYPLRYGWIPVAEVLETLAQRPKAVHVVITGRGVPQEIIEAADLVTEMCEVKHPFRQGVKGQPGIEF